MNTLPQELIEGVVGFVPDKKSLISCALTTRSFARAIQQRIFHWLPMSNLATYELLAPILTDPPHLGQYVRLLSLQIRGIPHHWAPFESILLTTTRVERLTIEAMVLLRGILAVLRQLCLFELLSSQSLRCVGLVNIGHVPRSIVTTFLSTCEEVGLCDVSIDPKQEDAEYTLLRSRTLWHLDLVDNENAMLLEDAAGVKLLDVHFSLRYIDHDPERYTTFVADVMTQLPGVLQAGFLTFSNRASVDRIPPMLRFFDDTES
ncbi:hypothetical protein C8R45DRAFT_1113831 [Mycena sanguinolenta]|nr:hypothetical protein C8R45DRAFT_1113831 [Mycena sanguinolenta]